MLQNLIVAVILIAVGVYVIYGAIRFFWGKNKKPDKCDGCTGCDLSNQIKKNNCHKDS